MENQTKTPEEIYARLLDMVALTQQLWMLDSDDGYVVIQIPEGTFLPLWQDEEAAAAFDIPKALAFWSMKSPTAALAEP